MKNGFSQFGISDETYLIGQNALDKLKERFDEIDKIAEINQAKVIKAMQDAKVGSHCFVPSTGYGYDDLGRDTLEDVYANCFKTEAALVRPQITCGTHAIATALLANLLPGDELFSPVGRPYDTLESVIGLRPSPCSLMENGVTYAEAELLPDGTFDFEAIKNGINERTKVVTIQRSKGYKMRPTFSVKQIGELISYIKNIKPDVICFVDNCYGEFVEIIEPTEVGADIMAGSLIKNPGGGLAASGGYIVGRKDLIDRCGYRLNSPGLGKEVGINFGVLQSFYQGLFFAPTVVASAVKGAIFAANVFESLGFEAVPNSTESRHDIVQSIRLGTPDGVIAFCEGIQSAAAVDSYATPVPGPMPGYDSEIIMAAGAFVQGSSIELTADAPMREPYAVYFQGGLTFAHAKLGILKALENMRNKGLC